MPGVLCTEPTPSRRGGGGAGWAGVQAGERAARPSPGSCPRRSDALSLPEHGGDGASGGEQQLQQRWVRSGPGQRGGRGASPGEVAGAPVPRSYRPRLRGCSLSPLWFPGLRGSFPFCKVCIGTGKLTSCASHTQLRRQQQALSVLEQTQRS